MKQRIAALAVLGVLVGVGVAQERSRVYTEPGVPPRQVLDRLNLKLAWRTFVPTESQRDGIYSMQLLGNQLIVQKQSGMIISLNAEDGTTQWRTNVGQPFRVLYGFGHNRRAIFAYNGLRLVSIDRATGLIEWEYPLPHVPGAPPAADDARVYLPLANRRLHVYELPKMAPPPGTRKETPQKPGERQSTTETPVYATPEQLAREPIKLIYDYPVNGFLEQTPLLTANEVLVADTSGELFAVPKEHRADLYQFRGIRGMSAPPAQYGNTAYAAANDFDVYALDIPSGRMLWRVTTDKLIVRKPIATDDDIYVAPRQAGLFRIDRRYGRVIWRNNDAERFLAHNKSLVYALDRFGCMLVLDRARGTVLSAMDVSEYLVPFSNELTDRIYLAANDGLIICLHDRDNARPMRVTTEVVAAPAADKKPEPKPADGAVPVEK